MERSSNDVFTPLFFVVVAAVVLVFVATPVLAQEVPEESGVEVTTYGSVASGRIFADQGFTLTEDPVVEFGTTVCSGDWCGDVWVAESLTGREEDHELDVAVWRTFSLGETSVETKLAWYELPGEEVWAATVTATHPLTEACEASASYQVMWAGFTDHVYKVEGSCTFETPVENLSATVSAGPVYSSWADSTSLSYEASLDYSLTDSLSLSFSLSGYEGKFDSGTVFAIGFARIW